MRLLTVLAIAFFAAAQPAGNSPFQHWTSGELKAYAGKLNSDAAPGKVASQSLGNWGNYNLGIIRRTADGEAELHENFVDIFIVQAGDASVIVGGKVVAPRTTGPGEVRGKSIEGGQKKTLKAGDILRVAANTPHQVLVPKEFLYCVVKVKQ